jgi:hypothetical protein
VLVAGGEGPEVFVTQPELYDPDKGAFIAAGEMTTARKYHTATRLTDGRVLLTGGLKHIADSHSGTIVEVIHLATAELYNPLSGTFSPTGDMSLGRFHHTATFLDGGEVLIAGGQTMIGTCDTAELYDPRTGKFRLTGRLNAARLSHAAVLL